MIYSPEADILARIERCQGFEWDAGNTDKNWRKHGVTREECEQVFEFGRMFVQPDAEHSHSEERFRAFGSSAAGRLLLLVFTLRNNRVRVI
jgi:uncharacterized DUF497 family protein